MEFRPDFTLSADKDDITAVVQRHLVSLTLTDYGGASGKSDELNITLASEDMAIPAKGVKLYLGLGFNGSITDKGIFTICSVQSSGPPRKLSIYATAAPMNGEKHNSNVNSQKTRSFDNVTLGDIVNTVATDNGLLPKVADELAKIPIEHIDQVRESDGAFLMRLAQKNSAVSKPSHGYWLFLAQGKGQTAEGGKLAPVTVLKREVSTWSYSEGDRGGSVSIKGTKKNGKVSGTATVQYFDKNSGELKSVQMDYDGEDTESPYTLSSEEEATINVKARVTKSERAGRQMTITGPCRPAHIPLTAECRIVTQGFGVREDSDWSIESLRYSLSSGGMTVDFSLVADVNPVSKKDNGGAGIDYGL